MSNLGNLLVSAGDAGVIGTPTNIGADEFFLPPLAITGPAGDVGERVATVNGTVNPMRDDATVIFQYGRTTAYGYLVRTRGLPAAGMFSPVTATLARLHPDTTYHYRVLVMTARGGATAGADRTFRTARA